MSDPVSSERVSQHLHVLVHVSLDARELGLHSFASSKPVSESAESSGALVGVLRLGSSVEGVVSRESILVVVTPRVPVVPVDFEGLSVGYMEVPAPSREALATSVGAEPSGLSAGALGDEPVDSQLHDLTMVRLSELSGLDPLRVDPQLAVVEHARVELDAGNGTVGVPLDLDGWVSTLVDVITEASRRRDVLLSWAETDPVDPPGSSSFLLSAELSSTTSVS